MEPEKKSSGALIGSAIIIIILIVGGIYLWQKKSMEINNIPKEETQLEGTAELETELNNIDLEGLDSDL